MSAQCFFISMLSIIVCFQLTVGSKGWHQSRNPFWNVSGNTGRMICLDSAAMVTHRSFMRPLLLQMFRGQPVSARAILPQDELGEKWSNEETQPFHLPQKGWLSASLFHLYGHDLQNSPCPCFKAHTWKGHVKIPQMPSNQVAVVHSPPFLPLQIWKNFRKIWCSRARRGIWSWHRNRGKGWPWDKISNISVLGCEGMGWQAA